MDCLTGEKKYTLHYLTSGNNENSPDKYKKPDKIPHGYGFSSVYGLYHLEIEIPASLKKKRFGYIDGKFYTGKIDCGQMLFKWHPDENNRDIYNIVYILKEEEEEFKYDEEEFGDEEDEELEDPEEWAKKNNINL